MEWPSQPKPRSDNFAPTGYAEVGANIMKKSCTRLDLNPRPHSYRADALPVEPQWHVIPYGWFAEFCRNATMRFTANKNVALRANTKAA